MKYLLFFVVLLYIVVLSEGKGGCKSNEKYVQLKCESWKHKYYKCRIGGMADARKVTVRRKVSKAKCKEGYSYGMKDEHIWVDHGCRAHFDVCYMHGGVFIKICRSKNYKHKYCSMKYKVPISKIVLVKKYSDSPCIYKKTYGFTGYKVWVTDGCDAKFKVYSF